MPTCARQLNGHRPEHRVISCLSASRQRPTAGNDRRPTSTCCCPTIFLTKVDRASMAVGLEVRPPLVDHEFLELSARIPSSLKVRGGETKWLFKQMCDGWLPDAVVHRPKQGFDIPVDDWLRGPLREVFEANVLSPIGRGRAVDRSDLRAADLRYAPAPHGPATATFSGRFWCSEPGPIVISVPHRSTFRRTSVRNVIEDS